MRPDDLIRSLNRADHLDTAYKTRACLAMSYPLQSAKLDKLPPALEEFDQGADDSVFEAALRSSGLMAIVEHLYPHETSQRQ